MNILSNAISKMAIHKKKAGVLVVGHAFNETFDHIFNYWIYIPIIALFGIAIGGVIMTIASFATCYLFVRFYDWAETDWLGMESLKETDFGPDFLERKSKASKLAFFFWWPFHQLFRLVKWGKDKGGVLAFFILSTYTDPFMTTVFLRRKKFGGLQRRDWIVFILSVLWGNFYWTLRSALIVLVAKFGIKSVF